MTRHNSMNWRGESPVARLNSSAMSTLPGCFASSARLRLNASRLRGLCRSYRSVSSSKFTDDSVEKTRLVPGSRRRSPKIALTRTDDSTSKYGWRRFRNFRTTDCRGFTATWVPDPFRLHDGRHAVSAEHTLSKVGLSETFRKNALLSPTATAETSQRPAGEERAIVCG